MLVEPDLLHLREFVPVRGGHSTSVALNSANLSDPLFSLIIICSAVGGERSPCPPRSCASDGPSSRCTDTRTHTNMHMYALGMAWRGWARRSNNNVCCCCGGDNSSGVVVGGRPLWCLLVVTCACVCVCMRVCTRWIQLVLCWHLHLWTCEILTCCVC